MKKIIYHLIQAFGIIIFAIGLSGISGHMTGNSRLYKWHDADVGMAVFTSVAFFVLGIILYLISLRITKLENRVDVLEKAGCKV